MEFQTGVLTLDGTDEQTAQAAPGAGQRIRLTDVIVSKAVANLVLEHFDLRPLGNVMLNGMPDAFEIFAVAKPIDANDQNPAEAAPASRLKPVVT